MALVLILHCYYLCLLGSKWYHKLYYASKNFCLCRLEVDLQQSSLPKKRGEILWKIGSLLGLRPLHKMMRRKCQCSIAQNENWRIAFSSRKQNQRRYHLNLEGSQTIILVSGMPERIIIIRIIPTWQYTSVTAATQKFCLSEVPAARFNFCLIKIIAPHATAL